MPRRFGLGEAKIPKKEGPLGLFRESTLARGRYFRALESGTFPASWGCTADGRRVAVGRGVDARGKAFLTTIATINRIATAVPANEGHGAFLRFADSLLEPRRRPLLDRMARKAQIERRYSVLAPSSDPSGAAIDRDGVFARGHFPSTGTRMELYEKHALQLAREAVKRLELGPAAARITHLVVTSCTGMYAPGLDLDLVDACGLPPTVERTMVSFMGCYAAINGLKLAHHIVRSTPDARVLMVNLELCTLHLQETQDLEQMLSFLIFGDGCAASLISRNPNGLAIDAFHAELVPDTRDLITWNVRDGGFDMHLSGQVPAAIARGLESNTPAILGGDAPNAFQLWAVHPGGRSILDAVERGLGLSETALEVSRDVLRNYGNMSSASVMFVLESLAKTARSGDRGCALSFGPGLTAESMTFHRAVA